MPRVRPASPRSPSSQAGPLKGAAAAPSSASRGARRGLSPPSRLLQGLLLGLLLAPGQLLAPALFRLRGSLRARPRAERISLIRRSPGPSLLGRASHLNRVGQSDGRKGRPRGSPGSQGPLASAFLSVSLSGQAPPSIVAGLSGSGLQRGALPRSVRSAGARRQWGVLLSLLRRGVERKVAGAGEAQPSEGEACPQSCPGRPALKPLSSSLLGRLGLLSGLLLGRLGLLFLGRLVLLSGLLLGRPWGSLGCQAPPASASPIAR